jgi:predicted DNA-binding protein
MSGVVKIRLTDELYAWLKKRSRRTGKPMASVVRDFLRAAMAREERRFLRHLGAIRGGDPQISARRGFSQR